MQTNRRRPIVLTILGTLLLAACGGGTAATSGPAGPGTPSAVTQPRGTDVLVDACALLTEADIVAVTGNTTETTKAGPKYGIFLSGCDWLLIDADAIVPPSIGFGVMTIGGKAYYDQYIGMTADDEAVAAELAKKVVANLGG